MTQEFVFKLIVGGLLTCWYDLCLGHTLEFFKVAMQTQVYGSTYTSIFWTIQEQKGIWGFLDGFFPWGCIQALIKGAAFSVAYAIAYRIFRHPIVAGGIGGFVQGQVLSPLLFLKTQVMTNPSFGGEKRLWDTALASFSIGQQIVQNQGVVGLMRGSLVFSMKRVVDWTSRYFLVGGLEQVVRLQSKTLSHKNQMVCLFLGGLLSTALTMPLDMVVSLIQKSSTGDVNVLKLIESALFSWESFEATSKGFIARALHVIFTTMIMRQTVPWAYKKWTQTAPSKQD